MKKHFYPGPPSVFTALGNNICRKCRGVIPKGDQYVVFFLYSWFFGRKHNCKRLKFCKGCSIELVHVGHRFNSKDHIKKSIETIRSLYSSTTRYQMLTGKVPVNQYLSMHGYDLEGNKI